jgi:hypothetical protein
MDQILTTYKKRQGDILTIAARVIDKMENNPVFPDPPAALEELKIQLPEFQTSLANAMGREKVMTSIKNNKKAIILQLLEELVEYVTVTCNGERTLMLSSGFDVGSVNGKGSKQPPTIEKLEVELGLAGEATTRIRYVANAIAFVHQYTTEEPNHRTKWYGEGSSLGSYTFQGLASEKRHFFRVMAIGYGGMRGYSPVVSRVIQ